MFLCFDVELFRSSSKQRWTPTDNIDHTSHLWPHPSCLNFFSENKLSGRSRMKWNTCDINPTDNSTLCSSHNPFILFVFSKVNSSSVLFTVKSTEVRVIIIIIIRSCSIQQSCCHGYPQFDPLRAQIENNSWLFLANTCQPTEPTLPVCWDTMVMGWMALPTW